MAVDLTLIWYQSWHLPVWSILDKTSICRNHFVYASRLSLAGRVHKMIPESGWAKMIPESGWAKMIPESGWALLSDWLNVALQLLTSKRLLNIMVKAECPKLCRDHLVYGPGQWEATLQCNVVSNWLGTYTKWSLACTQILKCISLKRKCWCFDWDFPFPIASHSYLSSLVCYPHCFIIYLTGCPENCGEHACYMPAGKHTWECCHEECIGGCSGPRSTDCFACKNLTFTGRCYVKCPPGTYEVSIFFIYLFFW